MHKASALRGAAVCQGLPARTPRAAAAPPPRPRTHDRIPASERVRAADLLTFASALLRCCADLCRPAQQRHDHVRQRARRGARIPSQQLAASREYQHACTRPLCPAEQLLCILLCILLWPTLCRVAPTCPCCSHESFRSATHAVRAWHRWHERSRSSRTS